MKMKKRLLALILCLVLAMSLLPITAAAAQTQTTYHVNSVEIEADGVYLDEYGYHLSITDWKIVCDEVTIDKTSPVFVDGDLTTDDWKTPTNFPEEGVPYIAGISFRFRIIPGNDISFEFNENPSIKLRFPGFESVLFDYTKAVSKAPAVLFRLTKEHEHDWRFTQTDSTLRAICQKSTCPTKEVSVSLKADSVTLPYSPFNAQLAGEKEFQAAFPSAAISKIRYDYKGSDGVWHKGVDPVAANAKAGEYQAFVEISSLPGTVVDESGTSLNQASLYVKYTAVDPKVTAQTGDNRPIEIMMASVLVFSALAAAAFILDNKRKYSR